jgi:hypothetical protein
MDFIKESRNWNMSFLKDFCENKEKFAFKPSKIGKRENFKKYFVRINIKEIVGSWNIFYIISDFSLCVKITS